MSDGTVEVFHSRGRVASHMRSSTKGGFTIGDHILIMGRI
jgi:hypothetical protein